jgi:uncharacterized protein (TIGR03085 family)
VASPLFDAAERAELCDLLDELGPLAPTLLAPWTTHDLAAHLVLREHDAVAAPGLLVPGVWSRFAERRRLSLKQTTYRALVETVRSGPPPGFFRIGWVRRYPNLNELFVHHEDVRRANGRARRIVSDGEAAALFRNVRLAPWFLARRLRGFGLELVWVGTTRVVRARRGRPTARVEGLPGELLLFLFGRHDVDVEITGAPAAVDAVRRTHLGM